MKVHCLFEQSGTFRDAFRGMGYEAYDYDIDDNFGKTDFQIDLFSEIERGYIGDESLFDGISKNDLVMAFFPCTRFSAVNLTIFDERRVRGYKNMSKVEILEKCRGYNQEQSHLYQILSKLFILSYNRGFKMVVENPYTQPHFLTLYFPIKPNLIDADRRVMGDPYCKPTQYWFVNFEPRHNDIRIEYHKSEFIFGKKRQASVIQSVGPGIQRSLISPIYARNFIRKYILEVEDGSKQG